MNEQAWQPKPGDFVQHKLRPGVKMAVVEESTRWGGQPFLHDFIHAGWRCKHWVEGKGFVTEAFGDAELEPWEEAARRTEKVP